MKTSRRFPCTCIPRASGAKSTKAVHFTSALTKIPRTVGSSMKGDDLKTGRRVGAEEKDVDRRSRIMEEKAVQLATDLWEQTGRPSAGPTQFLNIAREQLIRALNN